MEIESVLSRNNVKVFGSGTQPMLFAHGFGCDHNMWRYTTPSFEADYQIITFDYVGCGNSDLRAYDAARYAALGGYAQDIVEIIEALDLQNLIFVGHSVSAMTGLLAALQIPDRFEKLVMIGPSPCYINDGDYIGGFERGDIDDLLQMMDKNYMGWANALAPAIMGNTDRPELFQELEASFCSTDPVIAKQFARATFLSDNREDLSKLKVPALILQCASDIIAPLSVGEYMQKQIPNNSLVNLKATGHCPHLSHPDEVISVIKHYLNG